MPKGLIAFIIVAGVALGVTWMIEMKKSAGNARKRSDEILKDFRTIDNTLKKIDTSIESSNHDLFDSLRAKYK